ncbi:hypothetical protein HDU91_005497 [Kappamyces sp. JEL0680]|nr:hypothetical protein HDU91_005497 [Kappamyces sp. JEL0680]
MEQDKIQLFTYWRSSCSWRARLALSLKNIAYESVCVNLLKGEQKDEKYRKLNPNQTVPAALFPNGKLVHQSGAIIELLEELYPATPLLPSDPFDKAHVRALVLVIACDIHPIQNLRVLQKVGEGEVRQEWGRHWITSGFQALETMLASCAGVYCFGDSITLADVYLVPQVYNANR